MANLALNNTNHEKLPRSRMYVGRHSFTAAETTATVTLPFKTVTGAIATYHDTVAVADGPLFCTDSAGVLTVARVAGTTAGASFDFVVFGH